MGYDGLRKSHFEQLKKTTWLFRIVFGGWHTTQLSGDYFINHYKDPY